MWILIFQIVYIITLFISCDANDHYFLSSPPWSSLWGRGVFEEHQVFPSLSSALGGWSFHYQKHCTCKCSISFYIFKPNTIIFFHNFSIMISQKCCNSWNWTHFGVWIESYYEVSAWVVCSEYLRQRRKKLWRIFHASVGCSESAMRLQGKLILAISDRNLPWQI